MAVGNGLGPGVSVGVGLGYGDSVGIGLGCGDSVGIRLVDDDCWPCAALTSCVKKVVATGAGSQKHSSRKKGMLGQKIGSMKPSKPAFPSWSQLKIG